MYVAHSLAQTICHLLAGSAAPLLAGLVGMSWPVARSKASAQPIAASLARLRQTANRIYSRMRLLGLNETQLSERCSLAAIQLFEDAEVPNLTRDRVSKILMNRRDVPAASAARIISQAELAVLSNVLAVSVEWLIGQEENRDPVVWNVLANPDRVVEFEHMREAYEERCSENIVWSRSPVYAFTSEAFVRAFNQVHFGKKPNIPNPRPLVEFYNSMARLRRKWILRPNRSFKYTSLICRSHFEHVACGAGYLSAISKTILIGNLDVMMDAIRNPSLRLELVILNDANDNALEALRDYEFLGAADNLFSVWGYRNADVGWSENPSYSKVHRQLLDRLTKDRLCHNVRETVDYLKSLQSRLRSGPKIDVASIDSSARMLH